MGFFKDVHSLTKTGKEMQKTSDPGARMSEMTAKMTEMNQMLAQSNAALSAPPLDGVDASAQVVSVGMAAGSMNGDPIVPVELLVLQPGLPPRPVSTSLIVPVVQLYAPAGRRHPRGQDQPRRSVRPGRRLAHDGLIDRLAGTTALELVTIEGSMDASDRHQFGFWLYSGPQSVRVLSERRGPCPRLSFR